MLPNKINIYELLLRKYIIYIFIFIFSGVSFSQSVWIFQNSGTNASLNSVHFENVSTGWSVGDSGIILKTTNGGSNWFRQSSGYNSDLNSVCFTSLSTGFTVGDNGLILQTTNGGLNWISVNLKTDNYLQAVFFVNDTVGFTGGFGNITPTKIYRTDNGGNSWDSSDTEHYILSIHFINSLTGWISWVAGPISWGGISKTTDGGISWFEQISNPPNFWSVFFIDSLNGWFGAPRTGFGIPNINSTTDGGSTWIPASPWSGREITSLFFVNNRNGWATGYNGDIQNTTNGGISWSTQIISSIYLSYNSVYFADSLTGWVCGDSGKILSTNIITGNNEVNHSNPIEYFLSQNYPNPFNPTTNINYEIPISNHVSLKIFNVNGIEVAELINKNQNRGNYSIEWNATNFPSGIYFYKLKAGNFQSVRKMLLVK